MLFHSLPLALSLSLSPPLSRARARASRQETTPHHLFVCTCAVREHKHNEQASFFLTAAGARAYTDGELGIEERPISIQFNHGAHAEPAAAVTAVVPPPLLFPFEILAS